MGKLYSFALGMVAGFAVYHLASWHYVIRTEQQFFTTAKVAQSLQGTYVDVRQFGPEDWAKHPTLVAAIAKSGNEKLIEVTTQATVDNAIEQLLPTAKPE